MNLSPDAWLLIEGLLADYIRRMMLDIRRGGLTETGLRNYQQDLAIASEALAEIRGRAAA